MNQRDMYKRLISAEMDYAHFNALRTTVTGDAASIERGTTETFEYVLDPTRPTSTYYNRAVSRPTKALSEHSLHELPSGTVALELGPAQLTPNVAALLLETGFRPAYQLCYLVAVPTGGGLLVEPEVSRLDSSNTDHFLDLLQLQGVEFPPDKRAQKKDFYCTEQFQAHVVKASDGTDCGWSNMYVNGNLAFFGNVFVLPEYRRTGMHHALLAARLNAATEMGIELVYTDVEHGSQSHYNCEQAGFRTITIHTIWKRHV